MRVINRYVSPGVASTPIGASSYGTVGGLIGGSNGSSAPGTSRTRVRSEVAEFLETFGQVNKPFLSGAAGVLQPGDRPKIQRGFVRRANRTAGNPLSAMSLRFMYNPEQITRNYAAYLDQAAIDPFNTIFQSGNLVVPPSIVEFTFSLFFDRHDEATTNGPWSSFGIEWNRKGVLHDLSFFDAVLRNVRPGGTPNTLPDNGVMMVNPEDVTVVFSQELTVQGRPTNSRVRFTRFTNRMVPTRMEVDITLLIRYFGPLADLFGLDAQQQVEQYQALIPYDTTIGDGLTNTRTVEEAIQVYRSTNSALGIINEAIKTSVSQPSSWWQGANGTATAGDGGAGQTVAMISPVNVGIASNALTAAANLVAQGGGPRYSQPKRLQHGPGKPTPWHFDCSSLIWAAFKSIGAQGIFGRASYPATAGMLDFWNSSGWSTVQRVLHWSSPGGIPDKLLLLAQPGDLLFERIGSSGHISMVVSVDRNGRRLQTIAARSSSSTPQVGVAYEGAQYCSPKYEYLLRPALAGAQSIVGGR